MFDFLGYGFMQNALLAGLLASIVCGIVGTLVVVRRIVSLSGSVSHSAFGGIGIGYYLGINPILGALVFSIGSALGIGAVSKYAKEREDTVIGMFWAAGMARVTSRFKPLTAAAWRGFPASGGATMGVPPVSRTSSNRLKVLLLMTNVAAPVWTA